MMIIAASATAEGVTLNFNEEPSGVDYIVEILTR